MFAKKIFLLIFLCGIAFVSPKDTFASKSYGKPTLTNMPASPDIRQNEGGEFVLSPWHLTVAPDTFSYDIFFQTGCWDKSFPMRLVRYWQISDICEFRPKPFVAGNNAPAVPTRPWIITYVYTEDELGLVGDIGFPEASLKIVYSNDHGKSWTMLKSSTVNVESNTVSAITDKPGGFMVMAGFTSPGTYYNYEEVKGASTVRGQEDESLIKNILEFIGVLLSRVV